VDADGTVSVVIAAWNAAPFIGEALRSVLDQTVVPGQILVVDDGSTDTTAAIAAGFAAVTVLRRPHSGIGASRNAGLAAAAGEYVAFLDADDRWLPRKLARQLAAFADDPAREAVFTRFDEFADATHPPPPGARHPRRGQDAALPSTLLLPRRIATRIGPFAEGANTDWIDWLARLRAQRTREHVVPEVLVHRRIHDRNNSFVEGDDGRAFLAVAHQHLQAVRARRAVTVEDDA
jgi:glycosyltransferase involved in cell wall biosynthesis